MARVFLGRDRVLDRDIAIKILRPLVALDDLTRVRFEREVHYAARLAHPHVVDVYDTGEVNGAPYVIMEYVEGETLRQIIDEEAPFSSDDVAALVEQVASALDHAHARGVIHRDLKPQNIIVREDGIAKVVDFGITAGSEELFARTNGGPRTRDYMAPEVLAGRPPSPASDVYSLGTVAYEMLTGQVPYQTTHPTTVAREDAHSEPLSPAKINPALPHECDAIVSQALTHNPAQRISSAGQFATALANWRTTVPSTTERLGNPHATSSVTTETLPSTHEARSESWDVAEVIEPITVQRGRQPPKYAKLQRMLARTIPLCLLATLAAVLLIRTQAGDFASAFSGAPWRPFDSSGVTSDSTSNADARESSPAEGLPPGVPNVQGMSIDEARALLAQQGHSLLEDPPIFSDQVRAGTIAEQDPPAGTSLGVGNSVYIKVSRGSADDTLSNLSLEGQSVELARSRLTDLGLRVEQRDQGSRTVPTGAVIGVESTASASAGDKVTLIVSIGDKVQVPTDAFSASVDAASAKLDSTGLTVTDRIPVSRSTIERQIDLEQMDITPGDVVGVQNADGSATFGAWLERGDLVTLVYYDPSLD